MPNPRMPSGLGTGGRSLWKGITGSHELSPIQVVQLHEACRMKDRCDKLDAVLRGDANTWMELVIDADLDSGDVLEAKVQVAGALSKANETANAMKQLIAALRLPDEVTGKKPQARGPRGAQKPTVPGGAGKVTAIDRARERAAKKSAG